MEFSEFLDKFYLPDSGGGLVGYKSKKKIPMFFFEHGLDENYDEGIICPSDSTYEKWETGDRKPDSSIWAEVNRSFDDGKLQKGLIESLNERALKLVMENFEIYFEVGEAPDKMMFAKAIVAQFKAIASGSGIAENIVPVEYKKPPELRGFGTYLREAKREFTWIKMPGGDEKQLFECFVCNNIGTSSAVFPHRIRGNYIENATLKKIRTFDRRGEIRRATLVGSCGYGKTLMLQHLFLEAAEHVNETGLLPVFAELRNFSSQYRDLTSFLIDEVQEFDQGFTREKMTDLLERGQVEILLDGLDEMDPEEANSFQRKLADFGHHYSGNMVVISSRQCSALKGIRGFTPLYIQPLDEAQSQQLIDKLLMGIDDKKAKETILSFMDTNNGYVRKNGFVATNPMLLTIMVQNYEKLRDYSGNKKNFYELMYDALIRGHDEEKESYDRFFHSVGDGDEFTQVFREFCALAYMDGVFEFDHRSFEKYFKQLKSKDALINPAKFGLTAFQHDVCATACMMYEQESGIYYIDPGFQDYFFAEYFYFEGTESTKEMGRSLWDRKINSFRNLDALKIFYEMAAEKADVCILLPFLENIFKGKSDDEAFMRFLSYGYGEVSYTLLDKPEIDKYMHEQKAEKLDVLPEPNYINNIVMGLMFDVLNLPNTFIIGSMDEVVQENEYTTHFLAGFYDLNGEYEEPEVFHHKILRTMKHEIAHKNEPYYFDDMEFTPVPVRDNCRNPVCFGYIYTVDTMTIIDKPEQIANLIELCEAAHFMDAFRQIKDYYTRAADRQKRNEYR